MRDTKGFTVLVADQHSVTRAGVKAILAKEKCKVIEADNGRDAVRLVEKHKPQLAVMDITMPRLNGLDAANQILTSGSGTRVMMLTAVDDDFTIERAMWVGVHGYLCKSSPIEMLSEAVKKIMGGDQWYEPLVQDHLKRHAHMPGYRRRDPVPLTRREVEVFQLITEGLSSKEIGTELGMSDKTVDRHRQNIMEKIMVRDIAGMMRYAIRAGFVRKG